MQGRHFLHYVNISEIYEMHTSGAVAFWKQRRDQQYRPFRSQHVNILRSTSHVHMDVVVGLRRLRLLLFSFTILFLFRFLLLLRFAAKYYCNSRDRWRGKASWSGDDGGMIHLLAFNVRSWSPAASAPNPAPNPHNPKKQNSEFRRGYLYLHVEYHTSYVIWYVMSL